MNHMYCVAFDACVAFLRPHSVSLKDDYRMAMGRVAREGEVGRVTEAITADTSPAEQQSSPLGLRAHDRCVALPGGIVRGSFPSA